MAQNITEIVNSALIKLGAGTINSTTDTSREATLTSARVVQVIHRLLRDHPWRFATKLVSLAPTTDTAPERWTYVFQIPSDCLRIRGLTTGESFPSAITEYEIVGDKIMAQHSDMFLRYTASMVSNTESEGTFPDDFADAASALLAYEVAPSLTSSLPLRDDLYALYTRNLSSARFNGAVESPQLTTNDSSWLNSRDGLAVDNPDHRPLADTP